MSGFEFWWGMATSYGREEATEMIRRYCAVPMGPQNLDPDGEDEFCCEACVAAGIEPMRRPRA